MSILTLVDSIQLVKEEVRNSKELKPVGLVSNLCAINLQAKKDSGSSEEISTLICESVSWLIANPENRVAILAPINKALEILKAEFNPSSVRGSK